MKFLQKLVETNFYRQMEVWEDCWYFEEDETKKKEIGQNVTHCHRFLARMNDYFLATAAYNFDAAFEALNGVTMSSILVFLTNYFPRFKLVNEFLNFFQLEIHFYYYNMPDYEPAANNLDDVFLD